MANDPILDERSRVIQDHEIDVLSPAGGLNRTDQIQLYTRVSTFLRFQEDCDVYITQPGLRARCMRSVEIQKHNWPLRTMCGQRRDQILHAGRCQYLAISERFEVSHAETLRMNLIP
jgi:hypothetical protein